MTIELIKGEFKAQDALDILTRMIDVKIRFHESKITSSQNEEDIKMRESRIRDLQKDLFEIRKAMENKPDRFSMKAEIML